MAALERNKELLKKITIIYVFILIFCLKNVKSLKENKTILFLKYLFCHMK